VRQGKNKAVCKRVEVGSLSLLKIPVVIYRKSAKFKHENVRIVCGEKIRESGFEPSVVHRQPAEKLH
jgi:hypothetical protein